MATRRLTYEGPPPFASALVQMLEQEGVEVHWEPPEETRGLDGVVEAVVIPLLVNGAYDAIKAGVRLFRERFPFATVRDDEDEEKEEED